MKKRDLKPNSVSDLFSEKTSEEVSTIKLPGNYQPFHAMQHKKANLNVVSEFLHF